MAQPMEHLAMEEWKNTKKQQPPGAKSAPDAARTERLVAELRANLLKRKAAARGRDTSKGPSKSGTPD